jgi:hypothetical protein
MNLRVPAPTGRIASPRLAGAGRNDECANRQAVAAPRGERGLNRPVPRIAQAADRAEGGVQIVFQPLARVVVKVYEQPTPVIASLHPSKTGVGCS